MPFRAVLSFAALILLSIWPASQAARAQDALFETQAEQALLIDVDTNAVLFAKNADAEVPPASLAKMLTLEMAFDAIKTGRLSLETEFGVSNYAWKTGGAGSGNYTMFAEIGSSVPLSALIASAAVFGANDACIIIAEGMAGSEDNFAKRMNERAAELGLENSVFADSTGFSNEGTKTTMRDMAELARHIIVTYPSLYANYSLPEFTWNKIRQRNRDPLYGRDLGVDGLQTGYTEEGGYSIVTSAIRNNRRLILAISGLPSETARTEEARKLLDWGFQAFARKRIYDEGAPIASVPVYGGGDLVPVRAAGPVDIYLPISDPGRISAKVRYHWPIRAPIKQDTEIGELDIYIGDTLSRSEPLYTASAVGNASFHRQALDALIELVQFWH